MVKQFLERKDYSRREPNRNDKHDRNSGKKSSSSSSSEKRSGKSDRGSGKGSSKSDDRLPSIRQVNCF